MDIRNWNFIFGLFVGSSICVVFQWIWQRKMSKKNTITLDSQNDCIFFFPGANVMKCYNGRSGCCKLLSCHYCNYKKFLELIKSTKSSLDICVYLITSEELTNVVLKLFKKGIFVRIMVDKQMSDEAFNSKVNVFLKEHVPVKVIDSAEMMHNKFAIIDQKKLITGSFNWTNHGLFHNYENGIIIQNEYIVKNFLFYFQRMWVSA